MSSKLTLDFVLNLKAQHDNALVIYRNDDVYEIIGEDANWCIENVGLHNINAPGKINFVAYISTNTHITSKIIKLFKRVIFVDEIPQKTIVQLSLF